MANAFIDTQQSNRVINLNGSGKLSRTFVKDPNASDIRIGIIVSSTDSSGFGSVSSIFETFQFGLMSSNRTTQINSNVSGNISSANNSRVSFGGKIGTSQTLNNPFGWYGSSNIGGVYNSYELVGVTSTTCDTSTRADLVRIGYPSNNDGSMLIIRIYKITPDGSQFGVEFRTISGVPTTLESNMHINLSNLGNSNIVNSSAFSYTVTCSSGVNWDAFDTVYFTWPFYDTSCYIHGMGYRSIAT